MAALETIPHTLRSLQILRAVSVLSVIYFHIGTATGFGGFGVDIFFVLSGFVIALTVTRGQTPSDFALSRIVRIVPLYWIVTTAILAIAFVKPDLLQSTTANLGNYVRSLFFIPYYKESGLLQPMLALAWTLNYEMYFYACVLLGLLVWRERFMTIVAGVIFLLWLGAVLLARHDAIGDFIANPIVFEFVFGLLAFRIYRSGLLSGLPAIASVPLICASYAILVVDESRYGHIRLLSVGLPAFVLVLATVRLEPQLRAFDDRLRRWPSAIGDASYATYLIQYFVIDGAARLFFRQIGPLAQAPAGIVMATIVATMVVGQLTYEFADTPIRRFLKPRLQALFGAGRGLGSVRP